MSNSRASESQSMSQADEILLWKGNLIWTWRRVANVRFRPIADIMSFVLNARSPLPWTRLLLYHASAIDDLRNAEEEEQQAHQSGYERGGDGEPEPQRLGLSSEV